MGGSEDVEENRFDSEALARPYDRLEKDDVKGD